MLAMAIFIILIVNSSITGE